MKILVIIVSYKLHKSLKSHISIFNDFMKNHQVDYAGISCEDDFSNYEDIITFKYKIINPKKQLTKMCDFIKEYKDKLDYDWFIKIRPEVKLLEQINFDVLLPNSINAKARIYNGPKNIPYGSSVGGEGIWEFIKPNSYCECECNVVMDEAIYIFDKNVIKNGGFIKNYIALDNIVENEWCHTRQWKEKNINLNIIGINMIFYKSDEFYAYSGDIINPLLL
jgi:hypothetical protein